MKMVSGGLMRWVCITVAMLAVAALPGRSMAQFQMGGGQTEQPVTKRALNTYSKLLNLDADQKAVAETLWEGYTADAKQLGEQLQKKMQEMQEKMQDTGDFGAMRKEMPGMMKDFTSKNEALEKTFFDDLKGILTDQQAAKWGSVERHRRRDVGMRFGMVSGAAADLVAVRDRTKVTPTNPADFDALIEQYELDMDKKLQDFKRLGDEIRDEAMESAFSFDPAKINTMLRKFHEPAKGMRDTNRSYLRRLTALLNEEDAEKFEADFNRRSFPRVYREAPSKKLIDAAAKFNDLDESQRDQIASLAASYKRDIKAANDRWAKAIEDREEAAGGAIPMMMEGMMGGGGSSAEAVNKAREARRELDKQAKDRLLAILNPGQKDRLPEVKERQNNNPWMDMMGGDEDEGGE